MCPRLEARELWSGPGGVTSTDSWLLQFSCFAEQCPIVGGTEATLSSYPSLRGCLVPILYQMIVAEEFISKH